MEHRLKCSGSRTLSLVIFSRKRERIAYFYFDNVVRSFSKIEVRLIDVFEHCNSLMCPALNCDSDIIPRQRGIRVDVSDGEVKVADPRPIENYEALRSWFRTHRVLIQLSCVPCVGIGVLRHWSAWSRPPGRLFCKSNRRTGSPVVLFCSFLHLPPQRSLPLASPPSILPLGPLASLTSSFPSCRRLPFYF